MRNFVTNVADFLLASPLDAIFYKKLSKKVLLLFFYTKIIMQ